MLSAPLVVLLVGLQVASAPEAIPMSLVPLLIVVPALLWLDRVHPQPWAARIHAVLWGATITVLVAALVNTAAEGVFGESVSAVVVAPFVEETMKGLGVLWAVRRREVEGAMDGIVIAGWVALGFAVVEDMVFFSIGAEEGELLQSFVLRDLITPFAHPMVTFWTGLALGIAVYRRRPLGWALWGYAIAVATHALLNGAWEVAGVRLSPLGITLYLAMLIPVTIWVISARRKQADQFIAAIPALPQPYALPPQEEANFATWHGMLAHRRQLPRDQRRQFDAMRTSLARLTEQLARPGGPDPDREQELADQLQQSREGQ